MIKVWTWDSWKLSWRNPVSPSRVQNLVTQLSDPPAMRSIGLPLMYRAGLSLVCVQVRHSEYHCDILGLIWLVVHSVPNSQTTRRSHFPPTPSSVYWAAGWRYMKAVHVEEAATWIWLKYDTRFLQFEHYSYIYINWITGCFLSVPPQASGWSRRWAPAGRGWRPEASVSSGSPWMWSQPPSPKDWLQRLTETDREQQIINIQSVEVKLFSPEKRVTAG